MFIDSTLEMADNADVKLNAADGKTKVGSAIDVHSLIGDNATIDLSAGEPIYLVIEVTAAFVGTGANYKFDLTSSTEAALTGGTTADIYTTGTLPITALTVGKRFVAILPEANYHRYLGLSGTATSANVTTANINAFLTKDVTNWQSTATRVPATDPAT